MDAVFTAIERNALPKRMVYSDFADTPAMISDCEVSDRRQPRPAIGKIAPVDPWRALGNAEMAKLTGGASLPITALSYGAKKLGDRMIEQSIQRAMDVTGARSPLYAKQYAKMPTNSRSTRRRGRRLSGWRRQRGGRF